MIWNETEIRLVSIPWQNGKYNLIPVSFTRIRNNPGQEIGPERQVAPEPIILLRGENEGTTRVSRGDEGTDCGDSLRWGEGGGGGC